MMIDMVFPKQLSTILYRNLSINSILRIIVIIIIRIRNEDGNTWVRRTSTWVDPTRYSGICLRESIFGIVGFFRNG